MEDEILCSHHTERLFEVLDDLESRYGRIPSILATRADFTGDADAAIALHEESLEIASDLISARLSLQSLIRLLIDGGYDSERIACRLAKLEKITTCDCDISDWEELQELQNDFNKTKTKNTRMQGGGVPS